MIDKQHLRDSGARPITESQAGAKLVRLMAEGLLGVCDQLCMPYPESLGRFEETLVKISRDTGFQAGLSFLDKPSHRKFYALLGMDPQLAGVPYALLGKLAEDDASVRRGLALVSAFSTPANAASRELAFARSARLFREYGGPEFELIAQAFDAGDCQRDLVFEEMQLILKERAGGRPTTPPPT